MKNRKIVYVVSAIVFCIGLGIVLKMTVKKELPQELGYHDVEENDIFETGYVDGEIDTAPLNPAFMEFGDEPGQVRKKVIADERNFGWIPSPDVPEIHKTTDVQARVKSALPVKYDLRDPNNDGNLSDSLVPPVRNQGSCGACWAFATLGSIESNLLGFFGYLDDFSENNVLFASGFDWGACGGGNIDMSIAYLARNAGPIREGADPYDDNNSSYCSDCSPVKYIDSVVKLPVKSSGSDYVYIKQAISEYGALYASMYWGDRFYNSSDDTYYYSGRSTNHAITIMGWDDNKQVEGAPGDGAFIVRNSWGSNWGENGYFYISYYDNSLGGSAIAYFVDNPDSLLQFDKIYYYDTLGKTSSTGYRNNTAWGANIFTAENDGNIVAVSLYTNASTTSYEIAVYDNFDGGSFNTVLGGPYTGSLSGKGYHTVVLPSEVSIQDGDDFSVVVKFVTPGYDWPVPLEKPFDGYSSGAVAEAGQGYLSRDGRSWADVTSSYPNTSICIKALVREQHCEREGLYIEGPGRATNFLIENGQGTFIMATTFDDCGIPVTGVDVLAQLGNDADEPELVLYDDGLHGDGKSSDGLYAVELSGSQAMKATSVTVSASGEGTSANKGSVLIKDEVTSESGGGGGGGCFVGSLF